MPRPSISRALPSRARRLAGSRGAPRPAGAPPHFHRGARALEREGVRAITTNCGFLAMYQTDMAAAVSIPVFTSSLMLVPLVYRMLPPGKVVGIMTVDASSLRPDHFAGAGITGTSPPWSRASRRRRSSRACMLDNQMEMDVEIARQEHLTVARAGSWTRIRRSAPSCSSAPTCRRIARTSRPPRG